MANKVGRPRVITEQVVKDIGSALEIGATIKAACAYAGIGYDSYRLWVVKAQQYRADYEAWQQDRDEWESLSSAKRGARTRRGEGLRPDPVPERERQYLELIDHIKSAESRAQMQSLAKIQEASRKGSWQASAWLLERRFPNDYGRQIINVEQVDQTIDSVVAVAASFLPEDQLALFQLALLQAAER